MSQDKKRHESAELEVGTKFGKYQILRKLATGGMAEIFLARATGIVGFEKTVAIKRILGQFAANPDFVNMFLDEARLAANLQHPNIVQIYDVGNADGFYFFAMEFIHGQDCRSLKRVSHKKGSRIPLGNVLTIIHGAAAGLGYAHDKCNDAGQSLGLVHRDVSPANILLSYDGAVKVVDFGIAKAESRETKTRTGTIKGKIPYMPPEQCKGLDTDSRSDLFALGVVLYEMTVGRRPFRGENDFAILQTIINNEFTKPSERVPGYPEQLEAIVLKLLAPAPDQRYQRAEDLMIDLEEFAQDHGMRISTLELKRYMHVAFADDIEAWEKAQREGATLEEHVASHDTTVSDPSLLITPSVPGVELRDLPPPEPSGATIPLPRDATTPLPPGQGQGQNMQMGAMAAPQPSPSKTSKYVAIALVAVAAIVAMVLANIPDDTAAPGEQAIEMDTEVETSDVKPAELEAAEALKSANLPLDPTSPTEDKPLVFIPPVPAEDAAVESATADQDASTVNSKTENDEVAKTEANEPPASVQDGGESEPVAATKAKKPRPTKKRRRRKKDGASKWTSDSALLPE